MDFDIGDAHPARLDVDVERRHVQKRGLGSGGAAVGVAERDAHPGEELGEPNG